MLQHQTVSTLFAVIIAAMVVQGIFGFRQVMLVQRTMARLHRRYGNEYCTGYGQAAGWLFGKGCIVILVVNRQMIVQEARILTGRTVLSRFHDASGFIGCHVEALVDPACVTDRPTRGWDLLCRPKHSARERAVTAAAHNIIGYMGRIAAEA